MTQGFTRKGKFVPTGNDSESGMSSDKVREDDSQDELVNVSDAEKLKEKKS